MFSINEGNNSVSKKSPTHLKREMLHQQKAQEQKDKIKKSLRFQSMVGLILNKEEQDYNFINDMKLEEVQSKLMSFIQNDDIVSFAFCLQKIQEKHGLQDIFTMDLYRYFVQQTEERMNTPEIILVYKVLASFSFIFCETVFESNKAIKSIIRQINSLKESKAQSIYLQVLYNLTPSYLKRHQSEAGQIFDVFCETINNNTVDFTKALKLLKSISPYISEQRSFSMFTVDRILQSYEDQSQKQDPYMNLMTDCFLVLIKIIYYQKQIDIITSLRLMKMLLHAKINLPLKMVQQYYDVFVILAKLVEKTGCYQIQEISRADFNFINLKLKQKYIKMDYQLPVSQNYFTSLILNHIFQQNRDLLRLKQFSLPYLNFIIKVVTYCSPEVVMTHFKDAQFLYFLVQAIDYHEVQINSFALQIVSILVNYEINSFQIFQAFKIYSNIQTVLEIKVSNCLNTKISEKITLILDKFAQFNRH